MREPADDDGVGVFPILFKTPRVGGARVVAVVFDVPDVGFVVDDGFVCCCCCCKVGETDD